jgi:periplasmic divalent cation tolerance protein
MGPESGTSVVVVFITVPDAASGDRIAQALVEERLAACVSRVGPLRSTYRWSGAIESSDELLLLAKTTAARFDELAARVRALHPYQIPEIVALPVAAGFLPYLEWVAQETAK